MNLLTIKHFIFHTVARDARAPFEIIRLYLEAGGKADKCIMSHLDRTCFCIEFSRNNRNYNIPLLHLHLLPNYQIDNNTFVCRHDSRLGFVVGVC